jgi:hypothetical protein
MFKLAYSLGCYEALMKLGATVLRPELAPAQKAYMERLTGFGAPASQTPPTLMPTQKEWQRFSQNQIPELIGASENYQMSSGALNPEGLQRARQRRQLLDKWIGGKGQQIYQAPGTQPASRVIPGQNVTQAAIPSAIQAEARGVTHMAPAQRVRQSLGLADTLKAKLRPIARTLARIA